MRNLEKGQKGNSYKFYDVGAEKDAAKHATTLQKAYPDLKIVILKVPMDKPNSDISDHLALAFDKKAAFKEVMEKAKHFTLPEQDLDEGVAETVEELAMRSIPEIDRLVNPLIERKGFTLLGAIKGVGKSLFLTQLGLYFASGTSPFLSDEITIKKSGTFLLVQQEVSLPGMKDRLFKMRRDKTFQLEGRFRLKTTTKKIIIKTGNAVKTPLPV